MKLAVVLLCLYGVVKELRLTETYLFEYLLTRNLTASQIEQEVLPLWTYSYLAFLVPALLLTDYLRYRPVIILECIAFIATWVLLTFTSGLQTAQILECTYGLATASSVAFYTYLYSIAESKDFKSVTSLCRSALLIGRTLSFVLAQLFRAFVLPKTSAFALCNYTSLGSLALALLLSAFLPRPPRKQCTEETLKENETLHKQSSISCIGLIAAFQSLKQNYSNLDVLRHSLLFALSTCIVFQIQSYAQPLWLQTVLESNSTNDGEFYNGITYTCETLLSALATFAMQYVTTPLFALPIACLICCGLLVSMAVTGSIYLSYAAYVLHNSLYQCLATVTTFHIASRVRQNSYALVVGANSLLAVAAQSILTLIVADSSGLQLQPRTQFYVYAMMWLVAALVFGMVSVAVKRRDDRMKNNGEFENITGTDDTHQELTSNS